MTEKTLTYKDLRISEEDVFLQMGYRDKKPDAETLRETQRLIGDIEQWLRPRFAYDLHFGTLDAERFLLMLSTRSGDETTFNIGKIIGRQLCGSEAFAVFVATAGKEYESVQQRLKQQGDMVSTYIADALGSVIAEHCADAMERSLQESIEKLEWKHTNRFSPGYCDWNVAEQQGLFSLFPQHEPCGIRLTESSLMTPIKSVSGIIGVGKNVERKDYICGNCSLTTCYKRQRRRPSD